MKTKHPFLIGPCVMAIMLAFSDSVAEEKKSSLNPADEDFIKEAAVLCLGELAFAELGVKNVERSDVKEYAELLVRDYTGINLALKVLANTKRVELTETPLDLQYPSVFQKQDGNVRKPFDKVFLDALEYAHGKILRQFMDGAEKANDHDLKLFVNNTLPTLHHHLDKLTILKNQLTSPKILTWNRDGSLTAFDSD